MGVLAYNPVHSDYATVYPRSEPYDLAELARALPAHWRRPSKPADLATAPGRNCALFAALCKLALGGSDEGLLTLARTLNREFSVPLADAEVRGVWRSVCRYRARWRVQGHQQGWLWKQAARGRKGGLIGGRKAGMASGVVRRAGSLTERQPWADLGVSRATWYRRFRGAKTGGEGLRHERPIQIDRSLGTCSRRNKRARAMGPHFSDLATCPDAMGEGGSGGERG